MLLKRDAVYYDDSLNSIAALLGWENAEVNGTRQRWRTVVEGQRYRIARRSQDSEDVATWTDHDGAQAFIYGDLVHGDHDKPDAGGLEERSLAAYQLVLGLLDVVQFTLQVTYAARAHLGLEDDPCWMAAVTVGPAGWVRKEGARAYQAPLGSTYNADPGQPIGPAFQPFTPPADRASGDLNAWRG